MLVTTPWLRLRQIALLAPTLAPLIQQFETVFGMTVCHRDPAVAKFGLENVLFPIGNQFLEIVAPLDPESAGARQLARQGGAGGYMVITQCNTHAPFRARAERLGVRIVHQFTEPDFVHMQLHPRDTGGTFFEIDEQRGPDAHAPNGPWMPAGAGLQKTPPARVHGITAARLGCREPQAVAARWAELSGYPLRQTSSELSLTLENAALYFVQQAPALADQLLGIELATDEHARILQAAASCGLAANDRALSIAGIEVSLS